MLSAPLESQVQNIGGEILAQARKGGALSRFQQRQEELLLTRLMSQEQARVQLLRFVDVLPALGQDQLLVEHLEQYLGDEEILLGPKPSGRWSRLAALAHWGMRHSHSGLPAHVMAATVRTTVHALAGRFIAGSDAPSVMANLQRLRRRQMAFTLDLLGEATVSEQEAHDYQQRYLALLGQLAPLVQRWSEHTLLDRVAGRPLPRLHLSVKCSALYSQADPVDFAGSVAAIKDRLRPIALRAKEQGAMLTLDMEQYDLKDITLKVFQELMLEEPFAHWADTGLAMQAYLRDTEADLAQLASWARQRGAPVSVRLVRGAYWDFETVHARQQGFEVPVFLEKSQTDASYEKCLDLLFASYPYLDIAVGTHNVRSIALALALAQAHGLKAGDFELQMLYGMGDPLKEVLTARGQRVRVYVPFGELLPGMAYLVRRLLENTASQSFLRMSFAEDLPASQLLAAPLPDGRAMAPPGSAVPLAGATGSEARRGGFVSRPATATKPHTPWSRQELETSPYHHEPLHRFTNSAQRGDFAAAIERIAQRLGEHYPLTVADMVQKTDAEIVSVNPAAPGQVVGKCAAAVPAHVPAAVAEARRARTVWAAFSFHQRAQYLFRVAQLMREQRDELAAWEIFEAGKPWREADADVAEAIDFLEYYGRQAIALGRGLDLNVPGQTNRCVYSPRGIAVVITPWNFPLAIVTGMVSAALVTGNTVLLKPAPQTPVVAAQLLRLFQQAQLPPGALQLLPGGDELGKALVAHPDVDLIAFTGSMAAGCAINLSAAAVAPGQEHLKRVIAEMGGKNAIIVDRSADLDDAVRGVVASAFSYAGQKCSACSRLIVVGNVYEPVLRRVVQAAGSLTLGAPRDPGAFVGPVIDQEAQARITQAIAEGKGSGARLALEVQVPAHCAGYYVGPTVFADVDPQSFLGQEEIFGPVLSVMRAESFDDALAIANKTRYALTGGVYSRTPAHLDSACERFLVGNLYLNQRITGAVVGRQPFGGMKMSGVGSKAGGPDYLLQFVAPRTITENTLRRGFAPENAPGREAGGL